MQGRAERGHGGGGGALFTCSGHGRIIRVALGACSCTRHRLAGSGEGGKLRPSQDGNFLQELGKIECGPCSDSYELEICRIDFEFMMSERRMRMRT